MLCIIKVDKSRELTGVALQLIFYLKTSRRNTESMRSSDLAYSKRLHSGSTIVGFKVWNKVPWDKMSPLCGPWSQRNFCSII